MNAQIVSFHCVLKNIVGHVINTTFSKDVITNVQNPYLEELPGLAPALRNLKQGEKRQIKLSAADAYGIYNPRLVKEVPRYSFHSNVLVGDRVHMQDGNGKLALFCITAITKDWITLDANHPLAGQDLIFEIDVVEARDASMEEILESSEYENNQRYLH